MKRTLLLALFAIGTAVSYAQTATPYYSGFDNAAEKAGWTGFRKGAATAYNWVVGPSPSAVSSPNVLSHDYPVGASPTDTTIDWYVSPGFDFSAGGKIDSFRINVYSITGHSNAGDSLIVYLLNGSNDPALATSKVRLADLTDMAIDNSIMKDTGNFVIPPTSGASFIAFKYQAVQDWFVPALDNIHISRVTPVGIDNKIVDEGVLEIYPNPAKNVVELLPGRGFTGHAYISIFNVAGAAVMQREADFDKASVKISTSELPAGMYFVKVASGDRTTVKKLQILR